MECKKSRVPGQTNKYTTADWLNDSGKEVEIFMLCIILFFVIIVSSTIILYCDFSVIGFLLTSAKVRKLMVNIRENVTISIIW
jgi:hypothetical protein